MVTQIRTGSPVVYRTLWFLGGGMEGPSARICDTLDTPPSSPVAFENDFPLQPEPFRSQSPQELLLLQGNFNPSLKWVRLLLCKV